VHLIFVFERVECIVSSSGHLLFFAANSQVVAADKGKVGGINEAENAEGKRRDDHQQRDHENGYLAPLHRLSIMDTEEDDYDVVGRGEPPEELVHVPLVSKGASVLEQAHRDRQHPQEYFTAKSCFAPPKAALSANYAQNDKLERAEKDHEQL